MPRPAHGAVKHLNDFPDDILSLIFKQGCEEGIASIPQYYDHPGALPCTVLSGTNPSFKLFVTVLRPVCRRWHRIIDDPGLGRQFRMACIHARFVLGDPGFRQMSVMMSNLKKGLDQTNGCDIFLGLEFVLPEDDDNDNMAEDFGEHLTHYGDDWASAVKTAMSAYMSTIEPYKGQITTFLGYLSKVTIADIFLEHLANISPLNRLAEIKLHKRCWHLDLPIPDRFNQADRTSKDRHLYLPRLTALNSGSYTLENMQNLSNLTRLKFFLWGESEALAWTRMCKSLSACTQLTDLHISTEIEFTLALLRSGRVVSLHLLRALTLSGMTPAVTCAILQQFEMPQLEELSLKFEQLEDADGSVSELGNSQGTANLFIHLKKLAVEFQTCPWAVISSLGELHLHSLSLTMKDNSSILDTSRIPLNLRGCKFRSLELRSVPLSNTFSILEELNTRELERLLLVLMLPTRIRGEFASPWAAYCPKSLSFVAVESTKLSLESLDLILHALRVDAIKTLRIPGYLDAKPRCDPSIPKVTHLQLLARHSRFPEPVPMDCLKYFRTAQTLTLLPDKPPNLLDMDIEESMALADNLPNHPDEIPVSMRKPYYYLSALHRSLDYPERGIALPNLKVIAIQFVQGGWPPDKRKEVHTAIVPELSRLIRLRQVWSDSIKRIEIFYSHHIPGETSHAFADGRPLAVRKDIIRVPEDILPLDQLRK